MSRRSSERFVHMPAMARAWGQFGRMPLAHEVTIGRSIAIWRNLHAGELCTTADAKTVFNDEISYLRR